MPLVVKFADTQKDKDQKKTGGSTTTSNQSPMGASAAGGAAAAGLMGLGAANVAAASPVLRHSNLLTGGSAVLPSYLGVSIPRSTLMESVLLNVLFIAVTAKLARAQCSGGWWNRATDWFPTAARSSSGCGGLESNCCSRIVEFFGWILWIEFT